MFIDHVGAAFLGRIIVGFDTLSHAAESHAVFKALPWMLEWDKLISVYYTTRYIGRIAFPIYCFLLVEGFKRTRDVGRYALRLGIFAIVSEIPFDLCFNASIIEFTYQNVFFTLFIGLITMIAVDRAGGHKWSENIMADRICRYFFAAAFTVAGIAAAELLSTDYAGTGVMCVMVLYFFRNRRVAQAVAGAVAFSWEITAPLAFLPILAYNGKRGLKLKYFFYAFYPVHLLLIYIVCVIMGTGGIKVF